MGYKQVNEAIESFVVDSARVDKFVNGDDTEDYSTKTGVLVPSLRKLVSLGLSAFPFSKRASYTQGSVGARLNELVCRRALFGFEPEKLSANELAIFAGAATDIIETNNEIIESTSTMVCNLSKTFSAEANGLDVGSLAANDADTANPKGYYFYVVKNPTTGAVGVVASLQISANTVLANIASTGYTLIRKLPWGFMRRNGEIPNFHLSGWPLPTTRLTDSQESADYCALSAGTSTVLVTISVAGWLPDNARMAKLLCKVYGGVGGAYLRTGGTGGVGVPVGYSNSVDGVSYMTVDMRVTSARALSYKVTGSAKLDVYVLGYYQTERT